jgi:hypothetical protein
MAKSIKTNFDFDSFREDIIKNEKFETFKTKYGFKTREKLDIKLLELMRLDGKFYEYTPDPVVRGESVYESKDGFIKIINRKVEEIKSSLGCKKLGFGDIIFDGNTLIIEIKAA